MKYAKVINISDLYQQDAAPSCYVYVIHDPIGECCKVGIATDPEQRLATLSIGNPRLSLVPYDTGITGATPGFGVVLVEQAREIEKIAHALLADWAISGEWFSVSPEIAETAIEYAADVLRAFSDAKDGVLTAKEHENDPPEPPPVLEPCGECGWRFARSFTCPQCKAERKRPNSGSRFDAA